MCQLPLSQHQKTFPNKMPARGVRYVLEKKAGLRTRVPTAGPHKGNAGIQQPRPLRRVSSDPQWTRHGIQVCAQGPSCSPAQGSSVYGIFQARVLEWGAIAFSDSVSRGCLFNFHTILTPGSDTLDKRRICKVSI